MTDTLEVTRLRTENAHLRAFLDDATGRFAESDHLIPKWAKTLRTEQRRVEQLRNDVQSWMDRARAAEREVDRLSHELHKARVAQLNTPEGGGE